MTTHHEPLKVKSHVARDLLQSAALFKNEHTVVWEYTSNSLQYVGPQVAPIVNVRLDGRAKRISIQDNGRGMDFDSLQHFFTMHGENIDRKLGRGGRGRFGTGKSAAFGIANLLRVTTVRDGLKCQVELSRADIEACGSGDEIPVKVMLRNEPAQEHNGTLVEIEEVNLRSLDQRSVIRYIERHLAHYPRNVAVLVNNHSCEFSEPPIASEKHIIAEGDVAEQIGNVKLIIKVAKKALGSEQQGIAIFSKQVWYESTLVGCEGREMAEYIFGEIDVPALDNDNSPIPPFDMARTMRLNPSNRLVQLLYAFIGPHVDTARRELLAEDKRRKASEEAKRLQRQANEIAEILNEDFKEFSDRLRRVIARASGTADSRMVPTSTEDLGLLEPGHSQPADIVNDDGGPGHGDGVGGRGTRIPLRGPDLAPGNADSEHSGDPVRAQPISRASRGGFSVRFENQGHESNRASYRSDQRIIYINLDHPQLGTALGSAKSPDDPTFRRLAYEVAFSEYAIALAGEMASTDMYIDMTDPIVDIRETIERISRRTAELYR